MIETERRLDTEFEHVQTESLTEKRTVVSPALIELDQAQFDALIARDFGIPLPTRTPLQSLTPRHPYDENSKARIDSYHPGRWDTESDLVYMNPIVQTGPSPGEWDGTVIYASLPNLGAGSYLVSGVFSGYDTTMSLHGPWGTTTAYNAQTSTTSTVLAMVTGGQGLFFTLNCKGTGLGYLSAIEIYGM
jgi:hypothetical protein